MTERGATNDIGTFNEAVGLAGRTSYYKAVVRVSNEYKHPRLPMKNKLGEKVAETQTPSKQYTRLR